MYALYSKSPFSQKVTLEAKYDGGGNAEKRIGFADDGQIHSYKYLQHHELQKGANTMC